MAGTVVTAVRYIRKMRGGAQSQLLKASDGHAYVVKNIRNSQHIRVLANELLAARLGRLLGLPVADVVVIEVPDSLIAKTPELHVETAGRTQPWSSGPQFGSRYIVGPHWGLIVDHLEEASLQNVKNLTDLARALVFDKWTGNADGRQAVFARCNHAQYKMTLIDHGYCFNAGEWSFPDLALQGIYYRNSVYQQVTGWESFEPAITRAERMDINALWRCTHEIPEEWYEHDHAGMAQLIETLHQRRSRIRDLITAFRDSSRNPFPNWQDKQLSLFTRASLSE